LIAGITLVLFSPANCYADVATFHDVQVGFRWSEGEYIRTFGIEMIAYESFSSGRFEYNVEAISFIGIKESGKTRFSLSSLMQPVILIGSRALDVTIFGKGKYGFLEKPSPFFVLLNAPNSAIKLRVVSRFQLLLGVHTEIVVKEGEENESNSGLISTPHVGLNYSYRSGFGGGNIQFYFGKDLFWNFDRSNPRAGYTVGARWFGTY